MPRVDLAPLEEIFHARVLKMLKAEGKIGDALINNLKSFQHTGFSVHNGVRIAKKNFVVYEAEDFIAAICRHISHPA